MGILLGLVAAALYGSGDFMGGRASVGADTRRVLLVAQLVAASGAILLVLVVSGHAVGADLVRGGAAGVVTVIGLGALYQGLTIGRAGVVATVTAVVGSLVPVGWGVARGERPSAVVFAGVGLAIVAVALIAWEPSAARSSGPSGIGLALLAGATLGSSFVLYASTSEASGAWPVLAARVAAVAVAGGAVLVGRGRAADAIPAPLSRHARGLAATAGAFDVIATAALLAGVRRDLAIIVAAIAALAPGFTVFWAWLVLKEHLRRLQVVGLGLALAGLVTIAAG